MTDRDPQTTVTRPQSEAAQEDAIEAGIDAASAYVSGLPSGEQAWGGKEFTIAWTAARAAVAHFRKMT